MTKEKGPVTSLLHEWSQGDAAALEGLMPLVYSELHGLARAYFRRERESHTLQATALVNEVYLKLLEQNRVSWQNRAQFFGVTAQLMRRILVDHARSRKAAKRGGELRPVTLRNLAAPGPEDQVDLLALNDALETLGSLDADQARIVEMRYFAGLTIEETAEVSGLSPATVKRKWAAAKAWLWAELKPG
jgi:RNA polymerase sigma factor (TIGR02999 family)